MIFNFLRLACFQLACHIPTVGQVGVVEAASIKCGGGGVGGGGGGGGGGVSRGEGRKGGGGGGGGEGHHPQSFSPLLPWNSLFIFVCVGCFLPCPNS